MYQKEIDLKHMGLSMGLSPSQIIQNLIRAFHKYHLLRGTPYDYGNSHIKTIVIGPWNTILLTTVQAFEDKQVAKKWVVRYLRWAMELVN